jgi:hypothetical protein
MHPETRHVAGLFHGPLGDSKWEISRFFATFFDFLCRVSPGFSYYPSETILSAPPRLKISLDMHPETNATPHWSMRQGGVP